MVPDRDGNLERIPKSVKRFSDKDALKNKKMEHFQWFIQNRKCSRTAPLMYIMTVDHKGYYCGQSANSCEQISTSRKLAIFIDQADYCRGHSPQNQKRQKRQCVDWFGEIVTASTD